MGQRSQSEERRVKRRGSIDEERQEQCGRCELGKLMTLSASVQSTGRLTNREAG
jgi:hypothetical protein